MLERLLSHQSDSKQKERSPPQQIPDHKFPLILCMLILPTGGRQARLSL